VKCLRLPARSPNLSAFAKRWARAVKEECLSHLILFGEASLQSPSFKSIITKSATIKARTTLCSSPPLPRLSPLGDVASAVEHASAAYSGATAASREYFDQTRSR
jgi:hypothetical protein